MAKSDISPLTPCYTWNTTLLLLLIYLIKARVFHDTSKHRIEIHELKYLQVYKVYGC